MQHFQTLFKKNKMGGRSGDLALPSLESRVSLCAVAERSDSVDVNISRCDYSLSTSLNGGTAAHVGRAAKEGRHSVVTEMIKCIIR